MTPSNQDSITLTARCLCKANTFTASLPKSDLPVLAQACHCHSCRHVTGALYTIDIRWPIPREQLDLSKLKVFHHFPSLDLLFCPTCSSPMFFLDRRDTTRLLGVFTGVLDNEDADLIKVDNIFVEETMDGGASVWLRHNLDGSNTGRFKLDNTHNNPEELPSDWPLASDLTGYESYGNGERDIPIRCKCKGVDFVLHREDYQGVPDDELPPFIDPKTRKMVAGFCACDSCRLQCGIDVFNWTYASMKTISYGKSDKSFPLTSFELKSLVDAKEPALGTLTYYASSPDVERYFCSNCSACVFYAYEKRPSTLDVAIGVLDASDGARAESILSWVYGGSVGCREDCEGGWRAKLCDRIEEDGEEFRISRDYEKNWYRISKDENGGKSPKMW